MTTPIERSPDTARAYRLGPLGRNLDQRLARLQHLRDLPAGRADLAKLRRGLGKTPGDVPEIWQLTAIPDDIRWAEHERPTEEPSRAERAAHAAMTLYATHQQSMSVPAHKPGVTFATAVRQLANGKRRPDESDTDAVTRRFMAAATAQSLDELLTHGRGLITQLRSANLGFDYARFADDITRLLTPALATTARRAWGRDYYRTTISNADPDNDTATEN